MNALMTSALAVLALSSGGVSRAEPLCRSSYDVTTTEESTEPESLCFDGAACTLRAAINTATVCAAIGPQTVLLPPGAVFVLRHADTPHSALRRRSLVEETRIGVTGLPRVFGTLTLRTRDTGSYQGGPATIRRDAGAANFRLLHVPAGGVLTIDTVRLENGATTAPGVGEAPQAHGAGIYNEGRLILRDTVMSAHVGSTRGASRGGAIYNTGFVQTLRTLFDANQASSGAALYNAGGEVVLQTTRMTGNRSLVDIRSSVVLHNGGLVKLSSSSVDGNVVRGAPIMMLGGTAFITGSTIFGNSGGHTGALAVNDGEALVMRSTVDGNQGSSSGALQCLGPFARLRLADATITRNRLLEGSFGIGGLQASCAVQASNTVVAGNTPNDCGLAAVVETSGINVDSDATCSGFAFTAPDPQLGPLTDNGGPTSTRLPGRVSPLVNMGTVCERTDQRGVSRGDRRCDIGAVERLATDGLPRVAAPRADPRPGVPMPPPLPRPW